MKINWGRLSKEQLREAACFYEENGYLLVGGVEDSVTTRFLPVLAGQLGVDEPRLLETLHPAGQGEVFPAEIRKRLARVNTPRELADALCRRLQPLLMRLIGPFAQVSSSFHAQFKSSAVAAVDHGGYPQGSDFMEVHGPYLLHQDFTGAAIPTSPSAVTLWVGLNTCTDWNLRLYPGSHRLGMLCNRWMLLDDKRLASLGRPVDVQARFGEAVLFNAMLLHGTSNPGPGKRVSVDIRFFPLCGFLPSEPVLLSDQPLRSLADLLESAPGPVLRAPLLEAKAFLGEDVRQESAEPVSVLNWINYVSGVTRGDLDAALPHLERFVNLESGIDPPEVFTAKFHGRPLRPEPLRVVRGNLARAGVPPQTLSGIDRLLERLSTAADYS